MFLLFSLISNIFFLDHPSNPFCSPGFNLFPVIMNIWRSFAYFPLRISWLFLTISSVSSHLLFCITSIVHYSISNSILMPWLKIFDFWHFEFFFFFLFWTKMCTSATYIKWFSIFSGFANFYPPLEFCMKRISSCLGYDEKKLKSKVSLETDSPLVGDCPPAVYSSVFITSFFMYFITYLGILSISQNSNIQNYWTLT